MAQEGTAGFQSGMPGVGAVLGDAEIRHVPAFIKPTWRERQRVQRKLRQASPGEGIRTAATALWTPRRYQTRKGAALR
jgi:hypothetical protein